MRIEGWRSEDGRQTSDVRHRTSEVGEKMNVEHRTFNIEHRMGGAQSRREKRLNIFLFKILASLRLCVRNISYRFRPNGMGDAGNLVNLFRPLIHIPKEKTTSKRKRGFWLTAGC